MNSTQKFPLNGSTDTMGRPSTIADTSTRKTQNVIPDKDTGIMCRRGTLRYEADVYKAAGEFGATTAGNLGLAGAGAIPDLGRISNPIWCATPVNLGGVVVFAVAPDSNSMNVVVSRIGGSAWITSALNVAPETLPCLFGSAGVSYVIWGKNAKGRVGVKIITDGSELGFRIEDFNFNGANPDFKPNLATVYQNRTVYADGIDVVFSDVDDPLTIGNNASTDRNIAIGEDDGLLPTALKTIALTAEGTPTQTAVFVAKRRGVWLITGQPTLSTETTDYRGSASLVQVKTPAGCVSQHSVCDTPWGLIWCGPDDVWFMPFQSIPIPIGRRLAAVLKAQPEAQSFRIHAAYADGFYKLALFSDGQGPDGTTPLGEQWWLDLRDGPPEDWKTARWYGPQVFHVAESLTAGRGVDATVLGTHFMTVDSRPGAGGKLVGVHNGITLNGGTSLPNVTFVTYDNPDPRDVAGVHRFGLVEWQLSTIYAVGDQVVIEDNTYNTANGRGTLTIFRVSAVVGGAASGLVEPNWPAGGPFVDNEVTWTRVGYVMSPSQMRGSEALVEIHSKQYDFGTRMVEKLFQGLELDYFLSIAERITVTQLLDGGKTTDAIAKDLARTSGPTIGQDFLEISGDLVLADEFKAETWLSNEGNRVIGRSGQIQIVETPGIVLPGEDSDSLLVGIVSATAVEYTALLTTRYYATLNDLVTAILAALNADNTIMTFTGHNPFTLTKAYTFLTINNAQRWAPSIATAGIRYIWGLLGMTTWNGASGAVVNNIVGDEIPFDIGCGDLALNEANILYRPFNRRPNK